MKTKSENILLVSMQERWKKYRIQLKTCRTEFSEEAVHDLRVAARRLLAVLDVARALDPHPRIQKARKALKGELDSLDELRDTQVMLVEGTETIESLPELLPFNQYLHKQEKILMREARKQTRSSRPSELKVRVEKIEAMLEEYSHDEGFNALLLGVVDQAFLNASQAYGQIDAAQPVTIHRLRIAFKKFRYMVEVVHPILPEFPEAQFKRMHDYQSMMGDIQDADILLGTLADFAETGDSPFDPEPVRRYYEQRRTDLIAAFLDGKGELNIFWRSAPEQPFPWEKKHDPVHRPSRNRRGGGDARRRQSPPADRKGSRKIPQDRQGPEGTGNPGGPDPDQSLPAGGADRVNPGENV
jgi:CHAD domain-containing protein